MGVGRVRLSPSAAWKRLKVFQTGSGIHPNLRTQCGRHLNSSSNRLRLGRRNFRASHMVRRQVCSSSNKYLRFQIFMNWHSKTIIALCFVYVIHRNQRKLSVCMAFHHYSVYRYSGGHLTAGQSREELWQIIALCVTLCSSKFMIINILEKHNKHPFEEGNLRQMINLIKVLTNLDFVWKLGNFFLIFRIRI